MVDAESGEVKVKDQSRVTIGGMITDCNIKYTKTNKVMAFLNVEDLLGAVEVVVFPRDYEANKSRLNVDSKVFIRGKVDAPEEKDAKLICEKVVAFDDVPCEVWLQFENKESYEASTGELNQIIEKSDGKDTIVIFLKDSKAMKKLGVRYSVRADKQTLDEFKAKLGEKNVKVREMAIENKR